MTVCSPLHKDISKTQTSNISHTPIFIQAFYDLTIQNVTRKLTFSEVTMCLKTNWFPISHMLILIRLIVDRLEIKNFQPYYSPRTLRGLLTGEKKAVAGFSSTPSSLQVLFPPTHTMLHRRHCWWIL